MTKVATRRKTNRRGNVIVLSAFMMMLMLVFLAFTLDVGFVFVAQSQLQRSADSAALAAAWELIEEDAIFGNESASQTAADAKSKAAEYAAYNVVLSGSPELTVDDVQVGYMDDPSDPDAEFQTEGYDRPNAVRVRVQKSAQANGEVSLFFARLMGYDTIATQASATAAVLIGVRGFRNPSTDEGLAFLPFALDEDTWNDMLAGGGDDNWYWDPSDGTISSGSDGVREVNLFPQGTGSPGNRGTVDIGSNNNSTADIARQITDGVSQDDLSHHGGQLELDDNGELFLNGDTGISAGVKDELESIKGRPSIIPIFREVNGPGNNAMYTIVAFVGVRIMEVKLTGKMSQKRVIIQPARITTPGIIPNTDPDQETSQYVVSPVWLVR